MGTVAIALVAFAAVLGTAFTTLGGLVTVSGSSANSLRSSWREAERIVDSNVSPTSVSTNVTIVIADVDIVIQNEGRIEYSEEDFPGWEVIIRYQDTLGDEQVEYFDYAPAIAPGSWTVEAIYEDEATSSPEFYEPGIFNPNEEMVIRARLLRILGVGTVNQVTVSPPEGPRKTIEFDG